MFAPVAISMAVFYGIAWRRLGHRQFHRLLMSLNITREDNEFTPWTVLFNNTDINITQIVVHLKSGRSLQLDRTADYHIKDPLKANIHPYYTSFEGDITMVVTQTRESSRARWRDVPTVYLEAPWGLKLSYIPSREIAQVEVRTTPRRASSSSGSPA